MGNVVYQVLKSVMQSLLRDVMMIYEQNYEKKKLKTASWDTRKTIVTWLNFDNQSINL